jgi:hypothetical protein
MEFVFVNCSGVTVLVHVITLSSICVLCDGTPELANIERVLD